MQFEMTISMDGKGFIKGSKRRSLELVLKDTAEKMASRDYGDVFDWYGDKVGEWKLTGKD